MSKSKLKAVEPVVKKARLKLFLYGQAKVGKTTLAVQFPKPYVIDTEGSTDKEKYVSLIKHVGGSVYETQDFGDMIEQIQALLTETHNYKTLVIDSLTILYNDLLDKAEAKVGSKFGRHYGEANKQMKRLLNLLLRLDMNVIITSHSKSEYAGDMVLVGQTFDCYKKLDYLFDLILELQRRGTDRVIMVKGTRFEEFKEGENFACSYEEFAKRYDRETLERNAVAEELADAEQVKQLKALIKALDVTEDTESRWLKAYKATDWDEVEKKNVLNLIDQLSEKLTKKVAA